MGAAANLDCVAAKPLCTRIGKLTPGKRRLLRGVRTKSRSVRAGMLRHMMISTYRLHNRAIYWPRQSHILEVSVPWCDTMTSLSTGSNPTNPVYVRSDNERANVQLRYGTASEATYRIG